MKIYDISTTIFPGMVTWENAEPPLCLAWAAQIGENSPCNVSTLTGGMHTGTHLDAPLHFVEGGATVESLKLTSLLGDAQLVEIYDSPAISGYNLQNAGVNKDTKRLLLKTDNTRKRLLDNPVFAKDYVGIDSSGARWLVEQGIELVGMDYLSVGPYGKRNVETHKILLQAGIVVVEGLSLVDVSAGTYMMAALPLKIAGAEGSPCRVVLWEGSIR